MIFVLLDWVLFLAYPNLFEIKGFVVVVISYQFIDQVVKRLWAYIRENDLQDPQNRKKIICDERLKKLFNVNAIDMFQMNKALTKHIWPLEDGMLFVFVMIC
jgi:SWIB/MDM2 domain